MDTYKNRVFEMSDAELIKRRHELSQLVSMYDNRQMSAKILLNSL